MTNRWTIVLMASAALTIAGCNKDEAEVSDSAATEAPAATVDSAEVVTDENQPAATPAEASSDAQTATAAAGAAPVATEVPAEPVAADAATTESAAADEVTLPGGTRYIDQKIGTGEEARPGSNVVVHYTGTLTDGTKFDSSRDRGEPFEFNLGGGQVIQGWEAGVAGMKVGGSRSLIIPPDQGYGSRNMGTIPPNSTLLFDVELIAVK